MYEAQKLNSVNGDWVELVKNDSETYKIEMNEEKIKTSSKQEHKTIVKKKIKEHIFEKLKLQQEGHSKIRDICYKEFKSQEYLKTHILNNHEVSLLFSLRSRTAKQFKANFPFPRD